MKKLFMLTLSILLASCATTMPGHEIDTGEKKISATMEMNPVFTNDQIHMHQFSIKNNTNKWVEFDGATLEAQEGVSVLVGEKINSWIEACTLEKQVSDYNTAMALGTLAVAGAAVAASTSHAETANLGAAFALGSIGAAGVKGIQNSKNKVEFQKAFPKKHIFQSFVIPPGKVIQRWILLENPENKSFELKLTSKTGETVRIKIKQNITPAMI